MRKNFVSLFALLLVVLISATACSAPASSDAGTSTPVSASSPAAPDTSAGSQEDVTLEFFWYTDGAETQAMRKVLDAYEEQNPHVTVEMVEVPYADLDNKLMMAISGGEPPALSRVTSNQTFFDVALSLNDAFGGEDNYFAMYPEAARLDNDIYREGKIYTVPTESSITGMFYNKTAFDAAGVDVPQNENEVWTWDEFTEKLKLVMANGGVQYGMALDNTTQRWSTILYQFGGKYLNDDGSPAFTSEETLNSLNYTKQMFDEGLWIKSVWLGDENAANLFRSGQVAVHFSGAWNMPAYYENITEFEWDVTYMPYEVTRSSICGLKGVIGFEGSGVEEETKQLMVYLASKEASAQYCSESLFISPRLDCADIDYAFGTEQFAIFSNEQANTIPQATFDMKYPDWYVGCNQTIRDGLGELIAGSLSAEDFMAQVDAKTSELLGT